MIATYQPKSNFIACRIIQWFKSVATSYELRQTTDINIGTFESQLYYFSKSNFGNDPTFHFKEAHGSYLVA